MRGWILLIIIISLFEMFSGEIISSKTETNFWLNNDEDYTYYT